MTYYGSDSYTMAIANMELGDRLDVAYTAEYAIQMEYGTTNMPGRHFVGSHVINWQSYVDESAKSFS